MADSKGRRALNRFGAVVMSLAIEHGLPTQRALAGFITAGSEHDVSPHRLGRWLRGEHEPPWWFCEVLADLLKLSYDELVRLAMANTYGQRTYLDGVA